MSQQFPRSKRLLTAAGFRRVFDKPLKSADALFTVLARTRTRHESDCRLGLAIAKKQLRLAVDRNRIKRLSREVFRQLPGDVTGMDFVVMTRTKAGTRDNAILRQSLQGHFLRLAAKANRTGNDTNR